MNWRFEDNHEIVEYDPLSRNGYPTVNNHPSYERTAIEPQRRVMREGWRVETREDCTTDAWVEKQQTRENIKTNGQVLIQKLFEENAKIALRCRIPMP